MKDGLIVETIDTTNSLQGVVWEIKLEVPRGTPYNETPAWDSLQLEYDISVYTNLGNFVQRFHKSSLFHPMFTFLVQGPFLYS